MNIHEGKDTATRVYCLLMEICYEPTLVESASNFFVLCTKVKVYLYNYSDIVGGA